MKILAIETSCDETAVAVLEATGGISDPKFKVLGNALNSQASKHAEYGGVYPTLAKREHSKNLVPLLKQALEESNLFSNSVESLSDFEGEVKKKVEGILEREPELLRQFLESVPKIAIPDIDAIAVTQGPGLEPALWVGLNFAKALSLIWDKPLIPINHMEGHIFSVLMHREYKFSISNFQFPMISLLISGGHTQLVLVKDWFLYEIIGETRDDAVGEAFDKVARMLGLPYPGGPEISALADTARERDFKTKQKLPRPMIGSDNFDFSFSGLKTAVLYRIKDKNIDDMEKMMIAREFEDAVIDVLFRKTKNAIEKYNIKTLILGGGVSANKEIRKRLLELSDEKNIELFIPEKELTTDNAIMIGVAGYLRYVNQKANKKTKKEGRQQINVADLRADGNLRL